MRYLGFQSNFQSNLQSNFSVCAVTSAVYPPPQAKVNTASGGSVVQTHIVAWLTIMRRRLSATPPPMGGTTDGGAGDPLLVDETTCGCFCWPWRRRKASSLREPLRPAGEHGANGLPQQEEPSLGPDAKQLGQVVREIVSTERGYVADLELLATHFMPLLRSQLATSDRWGFRVDAQADELPDCSALLRIHTEVLTQLAASGESASGVATAFAGMAPYLRMYASYCSAYERALQAADELRRDQGGLALAALEAKHGQRIDSLLIKPVQRLCKYPLFFRELCTLLPESRPEYPQLRLLADEVAAINAEVNGKVLIMYFPCTFQLLY